MENKANYALIGAFVILAILGAIAFIAFISGKMFDEEQTEYVVVFTTPPRGISVGSEVRYNAIKMGEVTQTSLDANDPGLALVRIKVAAQTPVFRESFAQLEPLGLTGLSYIMLYPGDSLEPPITAPNKKLPRIEGRGSQLDSLIGGSESMIDNINMALIRANKLFSEEAARDFHDILENINKITDMIANSNLSDERVGEFLDVLEKTAMSFSATAEAIEGAARDVSTLVKSPELNGVLTQVEKTVRSAELTLSEFSKLANEGSKLTDETFQALEQFSVSGLQDLSASLAELRGLIETLNRASERLERNPVGFIVGQQKEITELPQ